MAFVRELLAGRTLDLLVLDEINVALQLGLMKPADVLALIQTKPIGLELVCTGRGAPRELIDADQIGSVDQFAAIVQQVALEAADRDRGAILCFGFELACEANFRQAIAVS